MEASQELIHEPLKLETSSQILSASVSAQTGPGKRSNPETGVLTAPSLSLRGQAFGMASSPTSTERRVSMPPPWRSRTLGNIQLARRTADDSSSSVIMGRKNDPLPTLRLQLLDQSNAVALKYSRGNREVAVQLRAALLDVNESVVVSNRIKEAMERELHNTRLDLELNEQCVSMRTNRPDAEKDPDRADDMLAVEKQQLQRQKRELENHLQCLQSSLQVCKYN
jgi:hypothetical protein